MSDKMIDFCCLHWGEVHRLPGWVKNLYTTVVAWFNDIKRFVLGGVFIVAGVATTTAFAEEQAPKPPELPLPEVVIDGEVIEPDVTIIKREEGTIHEYRVNGQLYMVKIQPHIGAPYYLVDRDGDGDFDSRANDPTDITIPQWILLRW
jgi:hypothetical protein